MEDVLELKMVKQPKLIIDNTIDERIMFPEKLEEANQMLEKYPTSTWLLLHPHVQTEQEENICTKDILKYTDVIE